VSFWKFLPAGVSTHAALHSHHSPGMVVLSAGIAMVAAFTALAVVDRIVATRQPRAARLWLALGASAMGLGIWAMHFTAMLAFRLSRPVSYDPALTAISLVPAILGSGVAIRVLSRPSTSRWQRLVGGIPMVLGIGVMHFTGMEAVQTNARLMYRPGEFILSLVVCYVLAVVALETRPFLERFGGHRRAVHVAAAVWMGLSVTCMHHTAMAAAKFLPARELAQVMPGIETSTLAVLVSLGSLMVVGLTLVATLVDARLSHVADTLHSAETRHRTVLESMSDGVFTFTPGGVIESVNHTGALCFGYSADELHGLSIDALLPSAHTTETRPGGTRITSIGRRRDGTVFPVEITLTAMAIHGERLLNAVVRDATDERRQAEAIRQHIQRLEDVSASLRRQSVELERERDRAEAAARAKSEFLAMMSHEIRTPMNGILATAELVLDGAMTVEQAEQMRIIRTSGEALLQVINQILDFSKIEAGKLTLDRTAFDVAGVLDAVRVLVAPAAERKGLELRVAAAGSCPRLLGDPFRLQQIVLNLAANAIKFTERGEVAVEASGTLDGERWRLRIAVRDTGIGIDAEAQARLFAPFAQADVSTTRRYGGTGLGLVICKRLIELMGGTIGVDSTPGWGSTFWIELPLPQEARPAEAALALAGGAARGASTDRSGWRILLAEDNATNQRVATLMLNRMGCEVEIAPNGARAVEAWTRGAFDLILMDCQMPEMDGFEATRAIRAAERERRTPIVAVTANAMEGDRQRCLAAGMDDYVSKPITKTGLAGAVDRLVERGLLQRTPVAV
jgi:PAS domain S-box-containing protein